MTFGEAYDYIKGQDRRSRQQWEMTRILAKVLHKVETGKNMRLDFPWDDENEEEDEERKPATKEELDALNDKARAIAEKMSKNRHDTVRDTIQEH